MDGNGSEAFRRRLVQAARKLVDPDVAEAPESQSRFINLVPASADIVVLRLCASVIFRIEIAFFIQYFGKGEIQDLTGFPLQDRFHIACHFLAEIDDKLSLRGGKDPGARYAFLFPDLLALLGDQGIPGTFKTHHFSVHGRHKGGIIDFPVVDFGETDSAFGYLPVCAGGEAFAVPVGVSNN